MATTALAAGTPTAVRIGAEVARRGGNAVDVAVAATFATWVCEPSITSLGSGGFVAVWPVEGDPVVLDGFATRPASADGDAARHVVLEYGGHTETLIGPGSIGVPGALAALEAAWRRWGSQPWSALVTPSATLAREGFPLPAASHLYFAISGEVIHNDPAVRPWYERSDGTRRERGETITARDLATTLDQIAEEGASTLYGGLLGERIGTWLLDHGSGLGPDDLAAYEALTPPPLRWQDTRLALAIAPTVGGAVFLELLAQLSEARDPSALQLARAMKVAFTHGVASLDSGASAGPPTTESVMARIAKRGPLDDASSTSHVSVVAADGLACSITTSTGYGSGVVVPETGFVLNNMLGELELLPGGHDIIAPGARLPSNMAPLVGAGPAGGRLALGAAGSSRIVSALLQVYLARTRRGVSLADAIGGPRCHLEQKGRPTRLSFEPGIDTTGVTVPLRPFDERHMYFGGVQAAERDANGGLAAAADSRRDGAAAVV